MSEKKHDSGRRRFLTTVLPMGTIACLGCKSLLAFRGSASLPFNSGQENKFSENPGMTTEEIYRFFYGMSIPTLQFLAKDIGRESLIKKLTEVSAEDYAQMMAAMAKDLPQKDMKAFAGMMEKAMGMPPSNKAFTYEAAEKTENVYEMKFTQCLPAKIWTEMKAADLGYAVECSPVDAMAKAFNPKMKGAVLKALMKGDGFCLVRFEMI
jgi:hypothetical protein